MQELSREKLLLDLENRLDYFFDSKDIIILKKVIKFNLILLDNIEQYFLTSNSSEKYLLNLYSIDNYDNLQFHGMKEVKMIENRRIIGKLITK